MVIENKLTGSFESRVKQISKTLTKTELKIVEQINDENKKKLIYLSISEFSEMTGAAEATIVRFCHKLDYNGYQDFKLHLSQELPKEKFNYDVSSRVAIDMIDAINESKNEVDFNMLNEIVSKIKDYKRIYIFAVGNSYISALTLRNVLLKMGLNVMGEPEGHMQTFMAANTSSEDLAIFISVSGSTKDIIQLAQIVKQNNTTVLSITSHSRSPLVQYSDYLLLNSRHDQLTKSGSITTIVSQQYIISVLLDSIIE